ncbi:non-ribosomal peptide synthetase family protein [Legionella sp. CNM-4043-24]|uniref:non-ribosomal peptide synthetase family protein n=1 Tax=Legionella sp. CNM-4043-24 TaxID=3421646 RepID=UPI00403B1FD8
MKKYDVHNSVLPFYFAHQSDGHTDSYNLCFSYQLKGEASVSLLLDALQELIRSQACLRQTFTVEHQKVTAQIHGSLPAEIHYFNAADSDIDNLEKALISEPHEIDKKSCIRVNVIKNSDTDNYLILFNIHHILMDGMSLEQFISDLNQLLAGKKITQEKAETYISRVAMEPQLQDKSSLEGLAEYIQTINDIADGMDYFDTKSKARIEHYTGVLPAFISDKLLETSRQQHISIFNLLLLAWGVFVAKLGDQDKTLINYPVNIRKDKSISGCFINTLTFPLILRQEDTYISLMQSCINNLDFFKHLARLRISLSPNIGLLSNFACSNHAKPNDLVLEGTPIKGKGYAQIANANISIKYRSYENGLSFSCDILSGIFPETVTSSLLSRFFNFVNKLLDAPAQPLLHMDLTFATERQQVLYGFNETFQPFPKDKTLIDLFEEQVERTPDNMALVFEDVRLTYTELNEKANQLTHYLTLHHQVKPDDLIALLLDRNEYTVIAILAVLKAGGAYVPLDLSYPRERIEYILEDTQAKIILINETHQDKLEHLSGSADFHEAANRKNISVMAIDSKKLQKELTALDKSDIVTAGTSGNLAYVIYTSGTTGRPKGVLIEHKSVVNTLHAMAGVYRRPDEDTGRPLKITAFTSYAFDVSVSEFFVPLLQGDELHVLSNTLRQDVILTGKYINDNQINYSYLPPVLLANLPRIKYPSLAGIIYAGEPCDRETALYWSHKTRLFNYYGPTETSIYATGLQLKDGEVNLIGKPIANTSAYVLNKQMLPQPIGVVGELYIGGAGVAQGYLNQSTLTAERFIDNPFQTEEEKIQSINFRLYKTGDLVRWTPDGNLEYLGRNDHQVKLRGYRIELAEIESVLSSYPGIKQSVVMVKKQIDAKDGHTSSQFLAGYYVADEKIPETMIQDFLAAHLPDYMHPGVLVHLTHLPVTPNGKLDRQALPVPVFTQNDNYVPPANEKEELVCKAFAKILAVERVGILDDFFKSGGSSIMAISLVSSLQANFNINVADIFNLKTPKKIASSIPFIKDNLKNNLEKIRLDYQARKNTPDIPERFKDKLDSYFSSVNQCVINCRPLPVANVLLTGATGFLGCNLLNTLLTSTEYSLFLLVRAESHEEAFTRINYKFKFYFDQSLNHVRNTRLFVYAADIEQKDLGLSKEDYQMLLEQVDSVIHSAALTKHYGDYERFYSANVQATINLLELSKLTRMKNFHYISTLSVLNEGYVHNSDQYIFTEDDAGDNLEGRSNVYVKTKYEGEKIVMKYRKKGVNSNIYRIGNLAFISSNCRAQENIEDNGFFTRLKCLINLGQVSPETGLEEVSPADLTAEAIVKLFDKEELTNNIYHVANPVLCNLGGILTEEAAFKVRMVTTNEFITNIIDNVDNPVYQIPIERFLLHRRWLNEWHGFSTAIRIFQDRTDAILKQLGFEWFPITSEMVINYIQRELVRDKKSQHT